VSSALFATKSINVLMKESEETGEHSLKRALGPVNLLTLGIGAIIGAVIFVITGQTKMPTIGFQPCRRGSETG
jgi:basic amino acid/polyamine antiporter, APA family